MEGELLRGESAGRRPGGGAAEADRRSACPPGDGGRPAARIPAPCRDFKRVYRRGPDIGDLQEFERAR